MEKEQILNCRFSCWYNRFADLTMKSLTIPLSEEFVAYLQDNGTLVLPEGCEVENNYREDEENENNLSHWDEDTSNQPEISGPSFSNLLEQITKGIDELGGKVFPKLTWSAPKDAAWMTCNSLKCTRPSEIILLLKSSDFVMHDLTSAFARREDRSEQHDINHELVLRKWANLVQGMEFRCFVKNNVLLAISQRHHGQYYSYIENDRLDLAQGITQFVTTKIIGKFPDSDFVVDVYKRRDGRMWVIDFNPFQEMTDPLLFSWEELNSGLLQEYPDSVDIKHNDGVVCGQFRFTGRDSVLQPSGMLSYRMPVDFVDLSTGSDATKLVDFMRMRIQDGGNSSGSDDDEEWSLPCDR